MPTETFTGVFRLVDKMYGSKCIRLFFQSSEVEAEPFCIPVWYNYSYKPYRGAGPSFKTEAEINDYFMIKVGESKNNKPVLMAAVKVDKNCNIEDAHNLLPKPMVNPHFGVRA